MRGKLTVHGDLGQTAIASTREIEIIASEVQRHHSAKVLGHLLGSCSLILVCVPHHTKLAI